MKRRNLDGKTKVCCTIAIVVILAGILLVCIGHTGLGGSVAGLGVAFAAGVLKGSGYFNGASS